MLFGTWICVLLVKEIIDTGRCFQSAQKALTEERHIGYEKAASVIAGNSFSLACILLFEA